MSVEGFERREDGAALDAEDEAGARPRRLLVVDDNPTLLYILARALAQAYRVVATTSAREALRRLRAGERFDLVLCDLVMPEMTGMALFRALGAVRPDVTGRILFLTGGACTPESQEFLDRLPGRTIRKPLSTTRLLERVRQELECAGG